MTTSSLDGLLDTHKRSTVRWLPLILMALIAGGIGWSLVARLDEVVIANGEVKPESRLKAIQHLEGGIIRSLNVQEGDTVKEGAPLVQLELAPSAINRDELQVRIDALNINRQRLTAESTDKRDFIVPPALEKSRPDLVRSERQIADARWREYDSVVGGLSDQLRQRELAVRELESQRRSRAADLAFTRERLEISRRLLVDNLTARTDHLQLQGQAERLQGEINTLDSSVPRASSAVAEIRSRLNEEKAKFARRAQEELSKVELDYARTMELLADATGQRTRTLITSPIDGVVKNMRFATLGGVVRPGEVIMEIVPVDDKLIVEAKLPPADRGQVEVGQTARVKVSAYDYIRYGAIVGKVVQISPDAMQDAQNTPPYFKVVVETEQSYLVSDGAHLSISPGMQATIDIHTGDRTIAAYFAKPVLKLKHEAFRER
jgi:adhesin transport system membrane fusion protein